MSVFLKEALQPWSPTPDSVLLRVLRAYDVPLAGIFDQSGQAVAFWCIDGHVERWSLWAYAAIKTDEIEAVASLPFENFVATLASRSGFIALAEDDYGIRADAHVHVIATARSVVSDLLQRLSEGDAASACRSLRIAS